MNQRHSDVLKSHSRYEIIGLAGRGGASHVYRAFDRKLDRDVALKVLAPHLVDSEKARVRLLREAKAAVRLKHPHIALTYDLDEYEGQPFIVMEWVEGRTLQAVINDEDVPLTREQALQIVQQLASALDYAHQQGVIHRDLKPSNVIIDEHGDVAIIDFGLGWLTDDLSVTKTGTVLGTPQYVAPEQIQGNEPSGAADQYSLAVVTYEMLAGAPPFVADSSLTALHHQLYETPIPISEHDPTLPMTVEKALERALSKRPEARFATLSDFSNALTLKQVETVRLSAPPDNGQLRLWQALAALSLLLLVGAVAWQLVPRPQALATDVVPTCNNFLDNGAFENGDAPVTFHYGSATVERSAGLDDSHGLKVGDVGADAVFGQWLPASAGLTYTFGGWFRIDGEIETAKMGISFMGTNNAVIEIPYPEHNIASAAYEYLEVSFTAPQETDFVNFWVYKDLSEGVVYVDDLFLTSDSNCSHVQGS